MRKLKPLPTGSVVRRKAYYLEQAMQFCLPFIKTIPPTSSGNLEPISQFQSHLLTDEDMRYETQVENSVTKEEDNIQEEDSATHFLEAFEFTQETGLPSESLSNDSSFQRSDRPCPSSSSSKRSIGSNVKHQNNNSTSVADLSVAEYFEAKRAKLQSNSEVENSSNRVDRQQGLKMFLLSLLPELEELDDSQIKRFKRQVLKDIDDITASGNQPQASEGSILTSPPPSYSVASQNMSNIVTSHCADVIIPKIEID